ncbi:hypothetical protein DSO57_1038636 [Entomophthora muscae]|uniref:Uncharacterized protein n=1 Tax=Entomophthora muscae TaxID=34485 RepID=A0ACC2RDE1_9FUNG|nr:hypothetical protein DSO57_1038636 [Entomophthora muscae]
MKCTDCKDILSPSVFSPLAHGKTGEDLGHPSDPDPPCKPPSSPSPPRAYVRNSK